MVLADGIGFQQGYGTVADAIGAALENFPPAFAAYSDVIDLATTGTYVVLPPIAGRLYRVLAPVWEIKSKPGAVSVSPTFQVGTNASIDNIVASGTAAGFISQPAETSVSLTAVSPIPFGDLTANGLRVQVTAPATGALTARLVLLAAIIPV